MGRIRNRKTQNIYNTTNINTPDNFIDYGQTKNNIETFASDIIDTSQAKTEVEFRDEPSPMGVKVNISSDRERSIYVNSVSNDIAERNLTFMAPIQQDVIRDAAGNPDSFWVETERGYELSPEMTPAGGISQGEARPEGVSTRDDNNENKFNGIASGTLKRSLDAIPCKSKKINLVNTFNVNLRGRDEPTKKSEISCIMKKVCKTLPVTNLKKDAVEFESLDEHFSNELRSYDDCQNNRTTTDNPTFVLNLKSAIDAMTKAPSDTFRTTRHEMTLAPAVKNNLVSQVKSFTQRPKDKVKCTLRQLTEKSKPVANISGARQHTVRPQDCLKVTTKQTTEKNNRIGGAGGASGLTKRPTIYNKQCAKITLRNITKNIDTELGVRGETQFTTRFKDCAKKTMRQLTENNIYKFINPGSLIKESEYRTDTPFISNKRACEEAPSNESGVRFQIPANMYRDSNVNVKSVSDVLCKLSGFTTDRLTGEGPKEALDSSDICLNVNKINLPSTDKFKYAGSLIPKTNTDMSNVTNKKSNCMLDISSTFLKLPEKKEDIPIAQMTSRTNP